MVLRHWHFKLCKLDDLPQVVELGGLTSVFQYLSKPKDSLHKGKPHSLNSIKLGWKPPHIISICISLMHFLWFLNSKMQNQSVGKGKLKGAEQILISAWKGCPLQKPQRTRQCCEAHVVKACASYGQAKLIQRAQTIHIAPGDTARGTVLSLRRPISLNTLLTAEATAKCINNLNLT